MPTTHKYEPQSRASDGGCTRRAFLAGATALSTAIPVCAAAGFMAELAEADAADLHLLGPRPGYSPQVGTLVSMLTWMREVNGVITATEALTTAELDHLFDRDSNSIGALMLHLAATETYYQLNTFEGKKWGSWSESVKKKWDPAMNLGEAGRKTIKGNNLEYYLSVLRETRARTLAEFKKRNDAWLMEVDRSWPWGPTNNLCKWFHVCEHESHHTGQIAFLKKRLPGQTSNADQAG